ncbi:MAG TPA: hypothetical protein VHJ59_06560 [Nitrososphaera sp.]|nr:hypothetical protein [Nitrososphaera sp.]
MEDGLIQYEDSPLDRKRLEIEIASAMSNREVSTANEIAEKFGIEVLDAVRLLNDHEFLDTVTMFTTAKLNLLWHSGVINELQSMLKSADSGDRKFAIDRIAKIRGAVKSGVEFNLHLEGLLDEAHEKKVGKISVEDDDITDLFPDDRGTYGKR